MEKSIQKSRRHFEKARKLLVAGVGSPQKSFSEVGGTPLVVERAKGAWIWDLDGNAYIDYSLSGGCMLLGHAPASVCQAVAETARKGLSFGAGHSLEVELAWLVQQAFPSIQRLRFFNSGTEAVLTALRLARAVTGRETILKFEGCVHGQVDSLMVRPCSGAALGVPGSAGVPKAVAALTLAMPFNDIPAVRHLFRKVGRQIAAIIVEPIPTHMGVVEPVPGFLEALRQEAKRWGSLLIFDEVSTGFKAALGGAQELYGVRPDLTCLGKVLGGGLPAAALGGRAEVLEFLSPAGPVSQTGSHSGNPLAMAAGIATLRECLKPGFYRNLSSRTAEFAASLARIFSREGVPARIHAKGSLLGVLFTGQEARDQQAALASDARFFARYFHGMLDQGVFLPASGILACSICAAHGSREFKATLKAAEKSIRLAKKAA